VPMSSMLAAAPSRMPSRHAAGLSVQAERVDSPSFVATVRTPGMSSDTSRQAYSSPERKTKGTPKCPAVMA